MKVLRDILESVSSEERAFVSLDTGKTTSKGQPLLSLHHHFHSCLLLFLKASGEIR